MCAIHPPPAMTSRHRHTSSFFSSLSHMLHFASSSTLLPASQTSERVHNYDGFEANLAQRLTLLLPAQAAPLVRFTLFRRAMEVLFQTLSDLRALFPELKLSLTMEQHKMVVDFLSKSANLFDACNAIREAILEVKRCEVLLHTVTQLLQGTQGRVIKAHIQRSRKLLAELISMMDMEKEIEGEQQQFRFRSLRWSSRHVDIARQWSSWHGISSFTSSHPARAPTSSLVFPKYADIDMKDCFTASVYAFHVITTTFFRAFMSALPCKQRVSPSSPCHPRLLLWAIPHLNLQEKILGEMRKRREGIGSGFVLELYQISLHVRQLFEFTEKALDVNAFPLSPELQEEMRQITISLSQQVMELETELEPFSQQIIDFSELLTKSRLELLDLVKGVYD